MIAGHMDSVVDALNKVVGELDTSSPVTGYARNIANTVENYAVTVRDSSVDELIAMSQDFGRRQPAVFLGAAALLGFVASRFLVASSHRTGTSVTGNYGTMYRNANNSYSGNSSYTPASGSAGSSASNLTGNYGASSHGGADVAGGGL